MSIFKEHRISADRSASDKSRHKQKIERAIRDGIHHVIADESIIGQDGKKKIRIPVRGIKEYQFVYGDNDKNQRVGSAPGKDVARGQQVGKSPDKQPAPGDKPGNEKGVEYYDVEITLEELAAYLFDSLELPELEKKQMKKIMSEKWRRHGYRDYGINPRLDKKKTLVKKLKRRAAAKRAGTYDPDDPESRFSFHKDDLKYKHIKRTTSETSNAVIFFMMDVSGSMSQQKKFLARSFYFLLYQFLNHRYENVDLVFIAHDVQAYEVSEEQFFTRGHGGGTIASSAPEKVLEIIKERYPPSSWNIYSFHCSDGDNWPSDMEKIQNLSLKLKNVCQLYCYCEIEPEESRIKWMTEGTKLSNAYSPLVDSRFKIVEIRQNEDIWPAFRSIFGNKLKD
jgi:hypothetical protein